jgi:hypothetical protein
MGNRRQFWIRHVKAWRRSGTTVRAYCQQHGLARGTLGYWSWKLNHEGEGDRGLVPVGRANTNGAPLSVSERPVEILVGGRYALRTWPGTPQGHLEMVLGVLERRP